MPEAYITATRQYVAQVNSWSLEELCLEVNVTSAQGAPLDACSFGIRGEERPEREMRSASVSAVSQRLSVCLPAGLKLQGATCTNNKLSLSNTISTELPLTQLRWMKQSSTEKRNMVCRCP